MQYVKVIGESHADAMRKLRETYGSEAIIYYEKEVPANKVMSRMLGKKQWMIQAALSEKKGSRYEKSIDLKEKIIEAKVLNKSYSHTSSPAPTGVASGRGQGDGGRHEGAEFLNILDQKAGDFLSQPFNLSEVAMRSPSEREAEPRRPRLPAPNPLADNLTKEASYEAPQKKASQKGAPRAAAPSAAPTQEPDMAVLKNLRDEIGALNEKISILIENPSMQRSQTESALVLRGGEFERLTDILADQGFSNPWIVEFVGELKEKLPSSEWRNSSKVYIKARELLASRIKVNSKIGRKRAIALVGPTGVGKTTTIAKLAARLKLKEHKKVSLITADNFRIAATEQLKVYGEIMDVPVYIARNGAQFQQIVAEESAEMILIDTTGVSQFNTEFMEKQRVILGDDSSMVEKHLVISAVSKPADIAEIVEQFEVFGIDRIILSKLDETRQYGYFVELAARWDLPFSFFTTGQKVPDDYLPADANYLAEKVLWKWKKGAPHLN